MVVQEMLAAADVSFRSMSGWLDAVIIVLVILLFGFIVGKILDRILRRLFADIRMDERLSKWFSVRRNYARATRHTIVRIIYVGTVVLALQRLSILLFAVYALLGLIVLGLFISLFLASKDLLPNISGRLTLKKKNLNVGDEITVVGKTGVIIGTVLKITPFHTRIVRQNGDVFFVPNVTMTSDRIVKRHAPAKL